MANNGEIMFFENTLHHYGCYFHVYKIVHLLYVKNLTNLIGTQLVVRKLEYHVYRWARPCWSYKWKIPRCFTAPGNHL